MNTDPTDNKHENSTELLTPGKRVALGATLGALLVTGAAHFSIDTTPKPVSTVETNSATVPLHEIAARQAAEHGTSLAEGDIPEALETALRDYQKMWDHDTVPTAESTSPLKMIVSTNIDIKKGDQLDAATMDAYLDLSRKMAGSGQPPQEIPQSVMNSLRTLDAAYEESLPSGSIHEGDKVTLQIVVDPTDPEHTTWAVVTDRVKDAY